MGSSPAAPALMANGRRRAFYAVSWIVAVLIIGVVGFHEIEGMDWINAIYFESMLATGQGPPIQLVTDAGKIFASVMSFVSVGSVISILILTLAPMIEQFWREGWERAEREAKALERQAGTVEKDMTAKKDEPKE
jgi:hypothetical protein